MRLKGLVSRADLNGKEAVVKDYDQEAGRWELELDGEKIRRSGVVFLIAKSQGCKPECLEALEKKEVRVKSSRRSLFEGGGCRGLLRRRASEPEIDGFKV